MQFRMGIADEIRESQNFIFQRGHQKPHEQRRTAVWDPLKFMNLPSSLSLSSSHSAAMSSLERAGNAPPPQATPLSTIPIPPKTHPRSNFRDLEPRRQPDPIPGIPPLPDHSSRYVISHIPRKMRERSLEVYEAAGDGSKVEIGYPLSFMYDLPLVAPGPQTYYGIVRGMCPVSG